MIGRVSLAVLLLAGCTSRETAQANAPESATIATGGAATRAQAIAAADNYLAARHMQTRSVIHVIDMGDRWRLSYEDRPGEGGTGGPILIVVNKRSGEVVHIETEQ